MENNLDKLEFSLLYLDISSFQEKQAIILLNTILNSRLQKQMKFISYGTITFDETDRKHQFPKVTYIDSFKRGKTHALVFDLMYNAQNNGQYDKLVIYTTLNSRDGYYGYVFYNSKEGKNSHRFLLDLLPDALITSLNRDFNLMLKSMIIDWYLQKSKAIQKLKTDKSVYVPGIEDHKRMLKAYEERCKIGYPSNVMVTDYWDGKYPVKDD